MANRSCSRSGNKQGQPHSGLFINAPALSRMSEHCRFVGAISYGCRRLRTDESKGDAEPVVPDELRLCLNFRFGRELCRRSTGRVCRCEQSMWAPWIRHRCRERDTALGAAKYPATNIHRDYTDTSNIFSPVLSLLLSEGNGLSSKTRDQA